ncbi:unnamed protein product, partial [Discosporangium mesarthrocarpum]
VSARRPWETLVAVRDQSWKQLTKTIMDIYVQRTHGTYVENKGSSLLWQYRDADPEFGFLQSRELEDHLLSVLKPFSLSVLRGGGGITGGSYVEVRPLGVNKGAFVSMIMERQVEEGRTPDFVLAVGDEESDEMMFEAAKDFSRGMNGGFTGGNLAAVTSSPKRRNSYRAGAAAAALQAAAKGRSRHRNCEGPGQQPGGPTDSPGPPPGPLPGPPPPPPGGAGGGDGKAKGGGGGARRRG